jgi:predicted nucleic acid-binding protein
MIVVDTNVIAYLYLPCKFTPLAELLLERDPAWAAPPLWRSELRNVLALYLRKKLLTLSQACAIQAQAELVLAPAEFSVASAEVLRVAEASGCTAYDCEFVALAEHLAVPFITVDTKLQKKFSPMALSLSAATRLA